MSTEALERRFAAWVDVVGDLLLSTTGWFPIDALLDEFETSFGVLASWNWQDADGSYGFHLRDPIPGWPEPGQMDYWAREALGRHPLIRWFACTQDLSAMTIGRVPESVSCARDQQIVREELLPVSLEQQLSVPYRQTATTHRAFVLGRSGADFDDEDLALARRIQPLVVLLARQCDVLTGCQPHKQAAPSRADLLGLTGREVAVLQLLAEGCTAVAIGHRLAISPRTVHVHLAHLYRKFDVNDRLMAVRAARECGVLPPRSPASGGSRGTRAAAMHPQPRVPDQLGPADASARCTAPGESRTVAWRPGVGTLYVAGTP